MLTQRDHERLALVDAALVRVIARAAQDNPGLFFVDKGAWRTVEEQEDLMARGVSRVKKAYSSKHVIGPKRPRSLAVDLYPTGYTIIDRIPHAAYEKIAYAIKAAALAENEKVEWGWDLWHWDAPHFQLTPKRTT